MNRMKGDDKQPTVTLFLFAYNQRHYIEEACRAALTQTYSPLEIIFSDDHSADGTFEKMEELVKNYEGPHKVRLNRNEKNIGLIEHVNKSFEISTGDLIVAAAGDDISEPDRVQHLVCAYRQAKGSALLIHSSAMKISAANTDLGIFVPPVIQEKMTLSEMADSLGLYIGATAAWDKRLYKKFGPIINRDAYEDLILGFRAALQESLLYIDKPLVRYRLGVGISTEQDLDKLVFLERIQLRRKQQKHAAAVYSQRLSDLAYANPKDHEIAKITLKLASYINKLEKELLFYDAPLKLLISIFTKNGAQSLKVIYSELRYIVKTWRRSK